MALRPALDLELLRTLVFIAEQASFTKAAERVGRTQSAVTLQIQKLESLVGQSLVTRSKGGPVELTPQGRTLVESARAMLKLNDEALRAVAAADAPVTVRMATSPTYVDLYLEKSLDGFRSRHPQALVEVTQGNPCQVAPQVRDGGFDLVVCSAGHEPRGWPATEIWRSPMKWVTSTHHEPHLREPLPLSLAPAGCPWLPPWMDDCPWRSIAMRALTQAGRPYRVVASATSVSGLYAPVVAGEAVTISSAPLAAGLRALPDDAGFPPLPDEIVIIIKSRSAVQPYTDALADSIRETFAAN